MFSTDFIFRQQENFVDNQKCQAEFRPLCNKILFIGSIYQDEISWKFIKTCYFCKKDQVILRGINMEFKYSLNQVLSDMTNELGSSFS